MGQVCAEKYIQNDSTTPDNNFSITASQEINTNKNHMIIVSNQGPLYEYSFDQHKIVHEFEKIVGYFRKIVLLPNKKSFIGVSSNLKGYWYDLKSHRCIKKFAGSGLYMIQTCDGKYLMTASCMHHMIFIRSTRNFKILAILNTYSNINSMVCSFDNRYVFVGHHDGWLSIIDLHKHCLLTYFQVMFHILKIIMLKCNNQALIICKNGKIQKICWKDNPSTTADFQTTEAYTLSRIDDKYSEYCLTKNQENLIVSKNDHLEIFNFHENKVIKKYKAPLLHSFDIIENTNKVMIATSNKFYLIDVNFLERKPIIQERTDNINAYFSSIKAIK